MFRHGRGGGGEGEDESGADHAVEVTIKAAVPAVANVTAEGGRRFAKDHPTLIAGSLTTHSFFSMSAERFRAWLQRFEKKRQVGGWRDWELSKT